MDGLPDAAPLAAAATPPPQQKRDEWSESGISRLLQAYEAKWLLRNRAKLKWSDWVDIASDVSAHCTGSSHKPGPGGSTKTPNQCKNKVESMKKRYRAESAAAARAGTVPGAGGAASAASSVGTSWRFFGRMDGLLKGPAAAGSSGQLQTELTSNSVNSTDMLAAPAAAKAEPDVGAEADIAAPRQPPPDAGLPGVLSDLLNADANGSAVEKVDHIAHKESSRAADSDAANASSPRNSPRRSKEEVNGGGAEEVDEVLPSRKRKGSSSELDVARSIELLASSFVKIERARMEMYRDTERMRAEAEVRKGEMELKRTEIMAKTQLQIARLFAKRLKECTGNGKNGGSSSEVDTLTKKGENGSG